MKVIPTSVRTNPIAGLKLLGQGKVRDTYDLGPNGYPGHRFVITTDRISVFDVILPVLVQNKGVILNLLDMWWRRQLPQLPHDVVAWGDKIASYLPAGFGNNHFLHLRGRVVKTCQLIDAEIIVRKFLTGTAWTQYKESGKVCGQQLPEGLKEWHEFDVPLFTPSTKSADGHDMPMDIEEFKQRFGEAAIARAIEIFEFGRKKAAEVKLVLVDTKFEMSVGDDPVVADEILTPDSSRYITVEDLARAQVEVGFRPASFDKQIVRDWAKEHLNFGPSSELTPELIARVHAATIPADIAQRTSDRYRELFVAKLTRMEPRQFLSLS